MTIQDDTSQAQAPNCPQERYSKKTEDSTMFCQLKRYFSIQKSKETQKVKHQAQAKNCLCCRLLVKDVHHMRQSIYNRDLLLSKLHL